ncbi:MAG TPA: NAD(P)-binding domain-containing protein [Prolixibacteraceae bacterium]|nr:NAD(P)-binding domain-containing protein [Prolixibacteraceae bacterium]
MTTEKGKKSVAVIGLGNIGQVLATNLVKNYRPILLANRTPEKATRLAGSLGQLARATDIPSAIREADVIILAFWYNEIREFLKNYEADLQGKIIVDPSNPIAPDNKGGFVKTIGENESAGVNLSDLLPQNAKQVKALGTLGAASLENAANQTPAKVLFYANDDTSINGVVDELIRDAGFEPLRIGGIDQSIRLEVFGELHEFGALGKTVTLDEVSTKI